jgi:hypothetical protein
MQHGVQNIQVQFNVGNLGQLLEALPTLTSLEPLHFMQVLFQHKGGFPNRTANLSLKLK